MDTLEEIQRQQITTLLKRVATLEGMNKSLFNRCFAVTHGYICIWCTLSKECPMKTPMKAVLDLNINKMNGGKTNE